MTTEWDNELDSYDQAIADGKLFQREKKMPEESKNILKSKSFWFNFAGAVATIFTNAYMDPSNAAAANPYIIGGLTAGNIFLRTITSQPVTVLPQDK